MVEATSASKVRTWSSNRSSTCIAICFTSAWSSCARIELVFDMLPIRRSTRNPCRTILRSIGGPRRGGWQARAMASARCTCGNRIRWQADEPQSDQLVVAAWASLPDDLGWGELLAASAPAARCSACDRLWIDWDGSGHLTEYVPTAE